MYFENIDFNLYEKAVGPEYAIQCCLELFIKDINIEETEKLVGLEIYKWLGQNDISVDDIFGISKEKGKFILDIVEKYSIITINTDYNLIMNYSNALDSLKYQYNHEQNKTK